MSIKSAEFGFRLEVVLNLAQRERKENDRRAQQTGCCRGFNFKLKFNHWQALVTSQPHACYLSSSTLHSSTRPDNMSSSISDLDRVSRRVLLIVEDCKEIVGL